jgi:hypothetical protein
MYYHRPAVLFTLFLLQRNMTEKILGTNPRIVDSLSCKPQMERRTTTMKL